MRGQVDSRRWGLVLIAAVLLAAAVLPNLGGRPVPGTARAAAVTGPPAVGDCVSDPIDPSWEEPYYSASPSGMRVRYIYPQVGMEACEASRYGEVTAVVADPAVPKITKSADGSVMVDDPNSAVCSLAAYRYIGAEVTGTNFTPLVGPWSRSEVISSAASTPSVRQQAFGQHWLACIVYLGASVSDPEAFGDQERYEGVLRDALSTGQERNRLGTCFAGVDLGGEQVACDTAHRSEILGSGSNGTKAVPRSELQSSCSRAVAKSTGIRDITAAGLKIQMLASDDNVPDAKASIPPGASLTCGVTAQGDRALNGSLLALGNGPIPWV